MLEFHTPKVSDILWANPLIEKAKSIENDASFTNLYLLRNKYDIKICNFNNCLYRYYKSGNRKDSFGFPLGSLDIKRNIDNIFEFCEVNGILPKFSLLTEEMCEIINNIYPNQFEFHLEENYCEYIYDAVSLAEFKGRKFHNKRNHIAQFKKEFTNIEILKINEENKNLALDVSKKWLLSREIQDDELDNEYITIKDAISNFFDLNLIGIIVLVEKKVAGMTIASQISQGVYDIHFEKGLNEFSHIYPFIINEFAKSLTNAKLINREEDLGNLGLRRSKLSLNPKLVLKKYTATKK